MLPEKIAEPATMNVRIRPLGTERSQLLREYLGLSIFVPPGDAAPAADVVDRPELACYVAGWGRYGDAAVLALDEDTGADLGLAWLRLWLEAETGYGFVDRATPELAIAVRPEHRGRGIGSCLLDALIDRASQQHGAVSLSVSADNPAVRLYQRLGFEVLWRSGDSLTMRKRLR